MPYFYFVLFVFVQVFPIQISLAQSKLPIKVSIFNEATAIPFTQALAEPIHPGLQIGTEFSYKNTLRKHVYQTANLGFIFHNHLYQGVFIQTDLGYDFRFAFGLTIKALLGIGYLHTFTTRQEFQLIKGSYVSQNDRGNARAMPSLAVGFGYRLKPSKLLSPEIFILYQPWIEYPYSPGFIPLMTHINLQLGAKFFLKKSK